jgi:hypothetical protein
MIILLKYVTINVLVVILKGLGGVSPNKSQNLYQEEASLVFNQLASVQEILPILSVISEVRIKHLHALKYTHHGRTYI